MSAGNIILRALQAVGVKDPAYFAPLSKARMLRRRVSGQDTSIVQAYLAQSAEPKLQIGGGWRLLDGWLNSDLALIPGVLHMDAMRTFPLPSDRFAFVFSEHMIEHIPYNGGLAMLRECCRIMRPGGVIRIATPDLRAMTALFDQPWSSVQQQYYDHQRKYFIPIDQPDLPGVLANIMVREWGHTFIYDEQTLSAALEGAGFTGIVRRKLGESDHAQLRGLDRLGGARSVVLARLRGV